MVGLCPPFAHFVTFRYSRAVSGRPFDRAPPWRWGSPPPQGSSLGCKLCCLAPSSLNRPHPPHPRAHCDFTAWRLIRNAFAVRERRGDPRVVPGFRCPFLPNMPSSLTPGSSIIVWSRTSMSTWPSPSSEQLGTPDPPAIRFTRGPSFGASWFTHLLRPVRLLALLYGSDRYARPPRAFTSRLPTDRSPSPLLGITTTATGLLCWRDLHPLEWQLASLHQNRTCGFPAYGLYGSFFVKGASRHFCRALLLHSFVQPAPRAFFHPDRTLPSPSRAAAVKDGASSAPPKACP